MIEIKQFQRLADHRMTTVENVVREFFQNLFLSYLYQQKNSEKLLFKGGTALRLIWQSPRFSEDLDFTGYKISTSQIESIIESTLDKIEREAFQVDIEESKKTTGGHLGIFHFAGNGYKSALQIEISLREKRVCGVMTSIVQPELLPPYTIVHLDEKIVVHEKILACLTRGKPRDFFDLYFILRSRMAFKEVFREDKTLQSKLLAKVSKERLDLRSELKQFLPASHRLLLKDFKSSLLREIERSFPER
ncbi:MAG: nucleotidyl transferase AbiEii/AbiGii toxin family protein [Deltaproteobacteria bacterium]|nr:nucleotidyl transferase AbiEii/AbiGii toxin family protein [Deltaproteobacteria bacterium]